MPTRPLARSSTVARIGGAGGIAQGRVWCLSGLVGWRGWDDANSPACSLRHHGSNEIFCWRLLVPSSCDKMLSVLLFLLIYCHSASGKPFVCLFVAFTIVQLIASLVFAQTSCFAVAERDISKLPGLHIVHLFHGRQFFFLLYCCFPVSMPTPRISPYMPSLPLNNHHSLQHWSVPVPSSASSVPTTIIYKHHTALQM